VRVLHVTTEYPPLIYGGLGTAVGGLVNASARAGVDLAVLLVGAGTVAYRGASPADDAHEAASVMLDGSIVVYQIPHDDSVNLAIRFARRWRPDVIHVHVFWLAHVAIGIREATGTPLVYTVHSLDRAEYEIGAGPPECLTQWNIQYDLIGAADRVIALTDDERDLITEYCANAAPRIRIVGNGIDDSAGARAAASREHSDQTITVLYTGRFVDRKGIRELLDAAPDVLSRSPNVRFVLAGGHRGCSGADMSRRWLPETCEPCSDRIIFTGWLNADRLNDWYRRSDILVVPSWYEPFGMVILEGMLYGLAIVASDVGGPRAIVCNGVNGLLCAPRDAPALSRTLLRLVRDHDLRRRLGEQAARDVRTHWLFDGVVQRMRNVYFELIAGAPLAVHT
jgi:glycogen(starch) synthase